MSNVPDRLREFDIEIAEDYREKQMRNLARKSKRILELEAENVSLLARIAELEAPPAPPAPDLTLLETQAQPAPDLAAIETQAKDNYYRILYSDGCGSAKTRKAHAVWTAARTARATQDAQDAAKTKEAHTGIKPALAIDWRNVGPLDEDERITPIVTPTTVYFSNWQIAIVNTGAHE